MLPSQPNPYSNAEYLQRMLHMQKQQQHAQLQSQTQSQTQTQTTHKQQQPQAQHHASVSSSSSSSGGQRRCRDDGQNNDSHGERRNFHQQQNRHQQSQYQYPRTNTQPRSQAHNNRWGGHKGGGIASNPRYDFETGQIDITYPVGWDTQTTLIASMTQGDTDTDTDTDTETQTETKTDTGNKTETSMDNCLSLCNQYHPQLFANFSFHSLRDRQNTQQQQQQQPTSSPITALSSQLQTPGTPAVFHAPPLPISFKQDAEREATPSSHSHKRKQRQIYKPPLLIPVMAARKAGFSFSDTQSSQHPPLQFFAYRHSLLSMIGSRRPGWRCDVQRMGNTILIRRHLDYTHEDMHDIGHMFEKACTTEETDAKTDHATSSTREERGFRGIVRGSIGEFILFTSAEIDAVQPGASSTLTLADLIELKTAFGDIDVSKTREQRRMYWLQSFLGGVKHIKLGIKERNQQTHETQITQIIELQTDELAPAEYKAKTISKLYSLLSFMAQHVHQGKVYKLVREKDTQTYTVSEQTQTTQPTDGEQRRDKPVPAVYRICLYEVINGIQQKPIISPACEQQIDAWIQQQAEQQTQEEHEHKQQDLRA